MDIVVGAGIAILVVGSRTLVRRAVFGKQPMSSKGERA